MEKPRRVLRHEPTDLLRESLYTTRPPSGNLRPSSDLVGPLRHAMLRAAGAPEDKQEDLLSLVRMETGTMWHDHFETLMRNKQLPVMLEVRLNDYLPEGWSGRADWITWSDEYRAFVLGDLKTIKAEGMGYIRRDGAKEAHVWQLSAYWYALRNMGLPLVKTLHVYYLPMSPLGGTEVLLPELIECDVLPEDLVIERMVNRARETKLYLDAVADAREAGIQGNAVFVNEYLAPPMERKQALRWDKAKGIFDVKLMPDWSTNYCNYSVDLCDCHTQGQTKIGHYEWDVIDKHVLYIPRKATDFIAPIPLTEANHKKMREVHDA